MDAFRQWAVCIIIAAAAGTFVTAISPKGSTDKTVRAVVGIFIVAAICAPLSQLKDAGVSEYVFAEYDYSYGDNGENELREYILSVCKSTVEKEILLLADEYNIRVESVGTDAYIDENECIIIQEIQVNIQGGKQGSAVLLSEKLSEKLGVPVKVNAE